MQICTTNPEFVMTAQHDSAFKTVLNRADLCIPDGVGLLYASYLTGTPLEERVAGSDLVFELANLSQTLDQRLFLLGAAPGIAEAAAAILVNRYPGLQIAGTYAGSPDPRERDMIVEMVNRSQADILFVAYGAPRQDKWIYDNRERLTSVRVALGVGGALDFVTGKATRAPKWVRRIGFEWLHRLIKEPWRWRRMLALPRFAWHVLWSNWN